MHAAADVFCSGTLPVVVKEGLRKEDEDLRKNANRMSNDKVNAEGVDESKRPPGRNPGEVLHQRRRLPYSYANMAIAGFLITGVVGYFALYMLKKPDVNARDVAKVATGVADPQDTHPRK